MEHDRSSKILSITALVVAVLCLSVGFAAYSSTLTIYSNAKVKPIVFDVNFSNNNTEEDAGNVVASYPASQTEDGFSASEAVINNSSSDSSAITNLHVVFTKPGQYAKYSFYIHNNGDYLAYLNNIKFNGAKVCTKSTGSTVTDSVMNEVCDDINISVKVLDNTYTTSTAITGVSIDTKAYIPIEVLIKYDDDGVESNGEFDISFNSIVLEYGSTN